MYISFKSVKFVRDIPLVILAIIRILNSDKIHPSYNMTFIKKMQLGFKMYRNSSLHIPTGVAFKAHLAMALKILEMPPEILGDIVECGTWKGGTAANLSLVCKIVGRKLVICDSFKGLPEGKIGDRMAGGYSKGDYAGSLGEVKRNIEQYGSIQCCEFLEGWFNDTLPNLKRSIVLAFVDVDLEDSLDTCIRYIWSKLTDNGYIFIDECLDIDYVALFYSERWWQQHFNRTPPGLIGAGTGLSLGTYYIGPWSERNSHPLQIPGAGAYTQKSMSGYWSYYPKG
jgi:Macrocin-O-methyltransferase (TylF)